MLLFASLIGLVVPWLSVAVGGESSIVNATALPLSEKFTLFSWPITDADVIMADQSFAFHLDQSAVLQLIDYKQPGDVFQLFDNGHTLGKTIRPTLIHPEEKEKVHAETPELALADVHQRFSKGQVLLSKGDHFITIKVLKSSANTTSGGGAIRLIDAPLKLQQLYKNDHDDDDDDGDDDDYEKDVDYDDDDDHDYEKNDDDYDKDDDDYEKDDDYHKGDHDYDKYDDYDGDDDEYDYTMTLTVVVPPKTPDLWRHRTEQMVTMMPAPAGIEGRDSVLPPLGEPVRAGFTAVTFMPPAGRENRNPMAGHIRF